MNNKGIFTSKKDIVDEINRIAETAAVEKNVAKRNSLIRTIIELAVVAGFTVAHFIEFRSIKKLNKSVAEIKREMNIVKKHLLLNALAYHGKLREYMEAREKLIAEQAKESPNKTEIEKFKKTIVALEEFGNKAVEELFTVKEENTKDKKKKKNEEKKADKE